ncbi:tetratricopeptide repeat protein [Microscilla marina]|uniref:Tetratricopeptide repeat domain protein n=1 Tax=Microscilla marina ATCC 23134 TaxID=313606 RepID=A1ZSV8_MICM2|nr:tetratricopeptide repeat protein [Microscilla marina]EAY26522.1 tetratricopeptide repeat domain protein [Microscilla marina ATCC 23134]
MIKYLYLIAFLIFYMTDTTCAQRHDVWTYTLNWAENHSVGKDRHLALRCLEHILAHDSTVAKAHYLKANIIRKWGWRIQALQHYSAALRHQPKLAKDELFMNKKYVLELHLKKHEEGHHTIDLLRTHYPLKVSYYHSKALLYWHQGAYDQAIALYDQAIVIAPQEGSLYLQRGDTYQRKGNDTPEKNLDAKEKAYRTALKDYQTALTKNLEATDITTCKEAIKYCQYELNQVLTHKQKQTQWATKIAPWTARIKADPNNYQAYWERAHHYEQAERYQEAKQDFVKALENPAIKPEIRHYLLDKKASCERHLKQYDQAIATINQTIALGKNPDGALFSRHYIYYYAGDYARSLADIDSLLAKYPKDGIYWGAQGEVLFKLERYADAWQAYKKAMEIGGLKAYTDENVAACKLALGLTDNRKALMDTLKGYYWSYELDKGLAFADTLLAKYPQDAEIYFYKGQMYKQYDKYPEAIAAYQKALELQPNYAQNEKFVNNQATMYEYSGQLKQAIAGYEAAAKLNFKDAGEYHSQIAELYIKLKDFAQAELHFGLAINFSRQDDDRADAYWDRGVYYRDEKHFYQQAKLDFVQSLKIRPNWADEDLAEVNQILAHLDTAEAITEQLKNKNLPNRAELLAKRAVGYYHSRQNKKALQDFEAAGKLKPSIAEDIDWGFYWGELAYLLKKYDRSIEVFNKNRQKHPKNEDVLSYLGQAYLDNGNYQEVVEVFDFFEKNCARLLEYAEIYAYRGKAKLALKDYAGALKDFERYLLYDPYLESYVAKEMKICKEKLGKG